MPEYPTSINRQTIISFPLNDNREDITTGIEAGSLYLNKILFEKQLNFGECHSDRFEVTLFDCDDITGETIQVYQLDYSEDEENPVRTDLFHGVVDSCTREDNGVNRKIVAYDLMYTIGNLDATDWWNTFWSDRISATIYEIFNSLITTFNIQLFPVSDPIEDMPNMQLEITQFSGVQAITVGTVLAYIGQICMFNPHFTATGAGRLLLICYAYGLFEGIAPQDIEGMYEDENSHFEEYVTEPVTRVVIYGETDVIAGEYGTGDNVYVFKNNPLLYNLTNTTYDAVAQTIYETLSAIEMTTGYTGICYKPAEIKMIVAKNSVSGTFGLGGLVQTPQGISIISSIEMSGTMLIEQTIRSVGNQKLTPDDFNLTDSKIGKVTEQATTTAKHFVWVPNDGAYVTTDNIGAGQAPTQNYSKLTDTGLYVATSGKEVAHFGIDENNEPVSVLGSTETGNTYTIMNSEGILSGKQITDNTKIDYFNINVPNTYTTCTANLVVSGNSGYLNLNSSEPFSDVSEIRCTMVVGPLSQHTNNIFFDLTHSRGGYDVAIETLLDIVFNNIELSSVSDINRFNAPLQDWFDAWYNFYDYDRSSTAGITINLDSDTTLIVQPYTINGISNYSSATHIYLVIEGTGFINWGYLHRDDFSFNASTPSRIDIVNSHFLDYTTNISGRTITTSCGENTASFTVNMNMASWGATMVEGEPYYQMTIGKSVETNQGLNAIVLGDNNTVTDDSQLGVFIVGSDNTVDNNRPNDRSSGTGIIGNGNEVEQLQSIVIGEYNDVLGNTMPSINGVNTIIGNNNTVDGATSGYIGTSQNVILGRSNTVNGESNTNDIFGYLNTVTDGTGTHVFGENLSVNGAVAATVFGRFNKPATFNNSGQIIFGNGGQDSDRHNAMEVGSGVTLYPTQSNALVFNNGGVDRTLYVRYQNDAGGTNVPIITVVPTGTSYGAIMGIGASGLTVVGGGESLYTIAGDPSTIGLSLTSEACVVSADSEVWIITNANTIANYKKVAFRTDGIMQGTAYTSTDNYKHLSYFDTTGKLLRSEHTVFDETANAYLRLNSTATNGAVQIEADTSGNSGMVCRDTSGTYHTALKLNGSTKKWYGECASTRINGTTNASSAATGTWVQRARVTIGEGLWILVANCYWSSNSSGYRHSVIATSSASESGGIAYQRTPATSGQVTNHSISGVANVTGDTTYYLNMYQNSGSSTPLSIGGSVIAVRVGQSV